MKKTLLAVVFLFALGALLSGQNSLDPYNFVNVGGKLGMVWNYIAQTVVPGTFTSTTMNEHLGVIVGGASPQTEYQAVQGPTHFSSDAFGAAIAVPAGATIWGANAVAGYANTSSNFSNVDASYFQCRVMVNNGNCWGTNPVVIDAVGLTSGVRLLNEFDVQPQNGTAAYAAVNGILMNLFAPGVSDGTTFSNAFGFDCAKGQPGGIWQLCYGTSDGAAATFALIGSRTTSASSNSQAVNANIRDAGNVIRTLSYFGDNSGAWTWNSFNGKIIIDNNGAQVAVLDPSANTSARTYALPNGNATMAIPASLTTTASASDNVTVTGMTSSGHCSLNAANASAATNIASTFISAKAANQITVSHAATANMNYDILCTSN